MGVKPMSKQDVPLAGPPIDCRACPLRGLELYTPLDDVGLDQLRSIRSGTRHLKHGETIHREGRPVTRAFTLFEGYALRYRMLSSGERQVLQFVMTGDLLCNLEGNGQIWPDTAEVVGHAVLCSLSATGLQKLFDEQIHMAHQIAEIRGAEKRLLEEHLMDIGQRSGFDGVARLLLELFMRENDRARTRSNRCYFPFRQKDIGDALGLTSVHVSRIYSELRTSGLMTVNRRALTIPDVERVARRLDYEPPGLHIRPLL